MSSTLSAARCTGVVFSGVKRGINLGSAGTGSRKFVPMVGCCQGSKPSAPATLKLWRGRVSEESGIDETGQHALDGLLQVTKVLEPGHLIVIDIVIVPQQGRMSLEHSTLCRELVDDRFEVLLNKRCYFRFD